MSEAIEVTLDADYEHWIEQIKIYAAISGAEYIEEGSKGEVITFCIDWIYVKYHDILQQIISVPVPYESLSRSTLEKLLKFISSVQQPQKTGESREIEKWYEYLIQNNKKHLERILDLIKQGAYFEVIEEESDEEPGEYEETAESYAAATEDEEEYEEKVTIQLNLEESMFKKLKWLKGILQKGKETPLSWGEVVMTCLIGAFTDLENLKGGFDLRIPFHSLGMEGAEQFEELTAQWITEAERDGELEEEIKVLEELRKAIQEEMWQEMRIKLKSRKAVHYCYFKTK